MEVLFLHRQRRTIQMMTVIFTLLALVAAMYAAVRIYENHTGNDIKVVIEKDEE